MELKAADSAGGKALRPPGLDRKCLGRKWLLRASPPRTAGGGGCAGQDAPGLAKGLLSSAAGCVCGGVGSGVLGWDWEG